MKRKTKKQLIDEHNDKMLNMMSKNTGFSKATLFYATYFGIIGLGVINQAKS